jgi:hypothetical protein
LFLPAIFSFEWQRLNADHRGGAARMASPQLDEQGFHAFFDEMIDTTQEHGGK